eukprot:scaffold1120_cov229-Pinguiococcus_pyrenoidosus.AAC.2
MRHDCSARSLCDHIPIRQLDLPRAKLRELLLQNPHLVARALQLLAHEDVAIVRAVGSLGVRKGLGQAAQARHAHLQGGHDVGEQGRHGKRIHVILERVKGLDLPPRLLRFVSAFHDEAPFRFHAHQHVCGTCGDL